MAEKSKKIIDDAHGEILSTLESTNYDNTDLGLVGLTAIAIVGLIIGIWIKEAYAVAPLCVTGIIALAKIKG